MRIMQVLDFSPPGGGGIVQQLVRLGETLAQAGHRLTLAFPRRRPWFDDLARHATVLEVPQIRRPIAAGFPSRLREICGRSRADLIHLHFSFALPFSLALGFRRWSLPVVYHWHNPPRALIRQSAGARLTGAAARLADGRVIARHIVVSTEIADLLVQNRWTNREKILRLPNAIGLIPQPDVRPLQRNSSEICIGCVANFRPQKDHATLMRAFAEVVGADPACRLILVGDGPTRGDCERLAVDLGIAEKVEFAGHLEDPSAVYGRLDVFALSSHYEGQGLVLQEAMNHGLPIVATDVGGISETLSDGVEGFLVPRQDVPRFADALRKLVRDAALRQRMGDSGRARVLRDFGLDRWVARLIELYGSVLREGKG